ncbi:chitobiase/beta-hexosaminidase C-terminal domain-containing protein [Desulfococcaceae bacterium HSG8]|nr:chitobiase/beta-hexosaminidase C-terminal domain-containing protein [Desulfococcaceae bacterium HSG8]
MRFPAIGVVCFIIFLLFMPTMASTEKRDIYEPDSTPDQAVPISYGISYQHNFHNAGDEDWSRFHGESEETYRIEIKNVGGNCIPVIEIYDENRIFQESLNPFGRSSETLAMLWTAPREDDYYVRVYHYDGETHGGETRYDFSLSPAEAPVSPDTYEEDDLPVQANDIFSDNENPLEHNFHDPGDEDWVLFYGYGTDSYIIEAKSAGENCVLIMELYEMNSMNLVDSLYTGGEPSEVFLLSLLPTYKDQYYYVRIRHYDPQAYGRETVYTLRLKNFPPDIYDEDDTFYQAKVIIPNDENPQEHNFHDPGDEDWVKFYGISGEGYTVETSRMGRSTDLVLELYDSDGETLLASRDIPQSDDVGGEGALAWACPEDDVYYVRVRHSDPGAYGEDMEYDLSVKRTSAAPALVGTIEGNVIDKLSREPVGGARIKTGANVSALSFSDGGYFMKHPGGEYTITAEAADYEIFTDWVKVEEGGVIVKDIEMIPNGTGAVADPEISPVPGTYFTPQQVEIICDTTGAAIRYTTDGSNPDENAPVYTEPIFISETITVKTRAYKENREPSKIVTAAYNITGKLEKPSFSPEPGTYTVSQQVGLLYADAFPGVEIRYTTDSTEPGQNSPLYTSLIDVSESTTIKAKVFRPEWEPSITAAGIYTITGTVESPALSLPSGTYTAVQQVEMSCATPDAVIRYTSDGTEPGENSPVYTSPIYVLETMTIKAKAFRSGWIASPVAAEHYTITGKAAPPEFSPAPGVFTSARSVELICETPDAVIHYTKDGSEPTANSKIYTTPISVSESMTIRAKAFKSEWEPSDQAAGIYTITGQVETPVFSQAPGTYTGAQSIELSCGTPGAVIHYTTDGTEPTGNSRVYTKPIEISSSMTVRAKGLKTGWEPGDTATGVYTITGTVANPTFSPDPGIYTETRDVELHCATPDAVIHFTTDGSEPGTHSPVYKTPILVSETMTIRAKAFKSGWGESTTAEGTYTITGKAAMPVFSPKPGTYTEIQHVTLSCATSGAAIHYTTDGSEPSDNSPLYISPIPVSENMTIRAKAFKAQWDSSDTASGIYEITGKTEPPVFSPAPGTYTSVQTIEIACTTPGAAIYYTTDGSEPASHSLRYTYPIPVSSSMTTIRAKAFRDGWNASTTTTGIYRITGTVELPDFSPDPGAYTDSQYIELSSPTPGAEIHYTTDGTEPVRSSPTYTYPIPVSATTTIRARAFKDGWETSGAVRGIYTITGTVASPAFSPDPGTYTTHLDAELSCATPGAAIYYTTDGTEPDQNSSLYTAAITVSATTTIRAKAFKDEWGESTTALGTYTITGTVESPSFSSLPGTYSSTQSITLTCETPGSVIRYTKDGSEPSENSAAYTSPIAISETVTIRAKAFKIGWEASPVTTGSYVITGIVSSPVFSPRAGTYPEKQTAELLCDTPGALIRYTTDGTEPTENSQLYTAQISVPATMTIRAKGFKTEWEPSETVTGKYTITGTVETPGFSPSPGRYTGGQTVRLSCATSGAVIHYTTDGTEPWENSPVYSDPVSVSASTTIRAKGFKDGWKPSVTSAGTYTITGTVSSPVFSPAPGTYLTARSVTLSCDIAGASVYYTTDGTDPTEDSLLYTSPIPVSSSMTIRAKAFKSGWGSSVVTVGVYTIAEAAEPPVFSPAPGIYTEPQEVELSSPTPDAVICYTTDGSEPAIDSSVCSSLISVTSTTIIKARAFKTGQIPSAAVTGSYTITGKVAAPVFIPDPGTYDTAQRVELQCATPDAYVYYTTDGSEPTKNSRLYTMPVFIASTTMIRAKVFKADWTPSDISEGTYTIPESVEPPVFSISSGTYFTTQDIRLSCATPGAVIHYTTDGSEPSEDSLVYSSPITVAETITTRAKAFKPGWKASTEITGHYKITGTVASPVFSPSPDIYTESQIVELSCSTPDAVIRCTTDNSEPTGSSPVCSSPVTVSETMTIRAKAFKPDWGPSITAKGNYIIKNIESPESGGCFIGVLK